MSATHPALNSRPAPLPPYVSSCPACGRAKSFGYDDLTRFVAGDWPRCCGQQMLCASSADSGSRTHRLLTRLGNVPA